MTDELTAERQPNGGIRICGQGIELRVSEEALRREQVDDGLRFRYEITEELYENLPPKGVDTDGCPFHNIAGFMVQVGAKGGSL